MQQDWVHPETKQGETFLINMNEAEFVALGWNSKRKGNNAYDGEGHTLNFSDYYPVFLQKEELLERKVDLKEYRKVVKGKAD